jgi:hypothetical protein
MGLAALVSVSVLTLAFVLGSMAFNFRRSALHEARLEKLVKVGAQIEQVTKGLEAERSPLLMSARNTDQVRIAAEQWGGAKRSEIEARAARWAQMCVFRAGDMIYFLYFDGEGKVREYVYVSI